VINSITVTGHLGSDPERRRAGSKSVTGARLAVSQGRERPSMWFDLDAWEGSFAASDLAAARKGDRVTVTGRLQMREVSREGSTRQYWTIRVEGLEAPRRERLDERDGDERGPERSVLAKRRFRDLRLAEGVTYSSDDEIPF